MRKENYKKLGSEIIKVNGMGIMVKWKFEMLKQEGAIVCRNEKWVIARDYPIIRVENEGRMPYYIDKQGNMSSLNQELHNHNNARIIYTPKRYSDILKELNGETIQNQSVEKYSPPIESYDEMVDIETIKF